MENMQVTSLEQLKLYSKGEVVKLPDFAEGQPFFARLKRPSMLLLAKNGQIPNTLLTQANSLFEKGGQAFAKTSDENLLSSMFDLIDIICEASFVEPSYNDIKENGIELTDEQMLFIFDYTQNGVKKLESFR